MPEGDTIHRIARRMGQDLEGRTVASLSVQGVGRVPELSGAGIRGVEARGKHLLVHFEPGWTLRVHLGMKGRWRRTATRSAAGENRSSVHLSTDRVSWTCARAYQAELIRTTHLAAHPRLSRLGPDLLAATPDIDGMVRRATFPGHGGRPVAVMLMDQTVSSGLGNVYKSEVLFLERVRPTTPTGLVPPSQLRRIFRTAHRLMKENLKGARRETVPLALRPSPASPHLWAYGRAGDPCLRCGTPVTRIVQEGRSTYYCGECQPTMEQE